jgi:hypothetical protein
MTFVYGEPSFLCHFAEPAFRIASPGILLDTFNTTISRTFASGVKSA